MRRNGVLRAPRSIGGLTLVVLALAPSPVALAREADAVVDLRTAPSWLVTGASEMGPAGDVNGDGVSDAVVADCGSGDLAGEVRVVWGPLDPDEVAFEDLDMGFSIHGAQPEDFACRLSMQPVGDVNGDGLADMLVGANKYYRSPATVYVVFGKPDSETVKLRDFDEGTQGDQGYVVHKWGGAYIGVVGLGDMNEDGLADFAVGGGSKTYVVFGQSSTVPVDLLTFDLGTQANRGFLITNRCRECVFGFAGDVNGDGVPDVGVGGVAWKRYEAPGSAYVVFGKSDPLPVDTTEGRTPQFFKIKGDLPGGLWHGAVSAAGDVNGDGLGDVIVGMPKRNSCCRGKAAVVFGKTGTGTVRLEHLGHRGFQIFAGQDRDFLGVEAAGVGDVDGDGFADVAIAADYYDHDDRNGGGAVFVIYGSRTPHDLHTGRLGDAGYVIVGRESGDKTGDDVGVPADMNGDSVPDLMISSATSGEQFLLWL